VHLATKATLVPAPTPNSGQVWYSLYGGVLEKVAHISYAWIRVTKLAAVIILQEHSEKARTKEQRDSWSLMLVIKRSPSKVAKTCFTVARRTAETSLVIAIPSERPRASESSTLEISVWLSQVVKATHFVASMRRQVGSLVREVTSVKAYWKSTSFK